VHHFVGDLAAAEAFYHQGLGLDRMAWSYPGALFLAAGGYHHHVAVNTWAAGARAATDEDARLIDWELVVPGRADVDAVAASLAHAARVSRPDENTATAADPWGIVVRIRPAGTP
jgi:catechol 2,3-dioxygenase